MRKSWMVLMVALFVAGAAMAQVKVNGGSLGQLAGSQTLVTVVFKSGAKDPNLRVVSANGATVSFVTEKGEQAIYTTEMIASIDVQGGAVEKKELAFIKDVLAPADKQAVDRAYARAKEIFDAAAQQQNIKISMAALMALNNDAGAQEYLKQLLSGGDLQTALRAGEALYLAGLEVPSSLLNSGLDSGNRLVKGAAAELCGLTKYEDAGPLLVRLAQDRAWEISGPASRGVARLGNREIIPSLIGGLNERNDGKASAVIWSMIRLGGDDIAKQLKMRLPQVSGVEKYRTVYTLYRLGDPEGKRMMLDVMSEMPTLAPEAAIALGGDGDISAMDMLRQRLKRREDETEDNLILRVRVAAALIRGGDPSAKGVLQEYMRSDKKNIRNAAFAEVVRLNNRTMLTLMQSSIENIDIAAASEAAMTAVALGASDFRARLLDLRAAEEAALGERKKK